MTENTIIIIGAGVAGLSAGCYAQMNGYSSQIFELHDLPGGLCTSWERKGYIFDGCITYLLGSGEGQPYHSIWRELGVVQDRQFINHAEMMRINDMSGNSLIVYSDPDIFKSHLIEISPQDAGLVRDFCNGIRKFKDFDLSLLQSKPKSLMKPIDWMKLGIKMSPFTQALAKWGLLSIQDFAEKFRNPFLKRAFPQIFGWTSIPTMVGISLLAAMKNRNAGFPLGGSLEFARSLEKRYLELGGQIHYNAQVEKILVENGVAVGIRLYSNEEFRSERVISACDGRMTLLDLLGKEYLTSRALKLYDGHLPIRSQLQVSLGVDLDFREQPHWITYLLDTPVLIAGEERFEFNLKHYCFDPGLAPHGKSSVILMLPTEYDYWQHLYGRRIYGAEQIQESDVLIDWVEKIYPGIKSKIEVFDVATPLSYERYTGNWHGSNCGWLLTKETMGLMLMGVPKTLPKVRNFYMAGQWVEPGGMVPVVAASGRNIVVQICSEDRRPFVALEP